MKRRLLNLLTALSLVLCVGSGAAWAVSRQPPRRTASFAASGRLWQVELSRARFIFRSFDDWPGDGTPAQKWRAFESSGLDLPRADFALGVPGCRIASGRDFVAVPGAGTYWGRYATFGVQLWPLPWLGGVLPLARLARTLGSVRSHRGQAGRCLACGYDLTGNVSGVCPECGTMAQRRLSRCDPPPLSTLSTRHFIAPRPRRGER